MPWTICTNLNQNRFQNIVFLVADERTDGRVENALPPASRASWRHTKTRD